MILECEISGNTSGSRGGGVHIQNSTAVFGTSLIRDNVSGERGGGVSMRAGSQAHFGSCRILDNEATHDGGGIDCYESSITLILCDITGNRAARSGGGLLCHEAPAKIRECVFAHNHAAERGGGLSCWVGATPVVTATLLDRNAAGWGGGAVHARGGSMVEIDCSILSFSEEGEAVLCEEGGSALLSCSDIYGNTGGDWTGCVAGQHGANGNFSADPLYCDAGAGDYALCEDSPCADTLECGQVGPSGVGCGPCGITGVERTSWGG